MQNPKDSRCVLRGTYRIDGQTFDSLVKAAWYVKTTYDVPATEAVQYCQTLPNVLQ